MGIFPTNYTAGNMMTCSGFGTEGFEFFGVCTLSWLIFAVLLFLVLVLRRQCDDGFLAGVDFNFWGAMIASLSGLVITVTFFHAPKIGLIIGLAGILVGGFLLGKILGSGGGEEDYE